MKKHINYYFLLVASSLVLFGMLFLATLSAPQSLKFFGNTNYYLFHQLKSAVIGLILALIVLKTPINLFKKWAPVLFWVNIVLMAIVFIPYVGSGHWGATRWINIWGNTFQPSEFLKITSILYLSAILSTRFSPNPKGGGLRASSIYHNFIRVFLPLLFLLAVISLMLFLQKDMSTLGIIGLSLVVVYFAAGTPIWHTLSACFLGLAGAAAFVFSESYRVERLKSILRPEADPLGIGLQLKQSLIALGSGGIFGNGWGLSTQKFGFLPQAMSDSVFAIIGEELGIIGAMILVGLFVYFMWLGFKISDSATDKFCKLTAVGISVWIIFQTSISITSAIGIFPVSGIPLPFFSYGGSHLIAEMVAVGLLLNISKNG